MFNWDDYVRRVSARGSSATLLIVGGMEDAEAALLEEHSRMFTAQGASCVWLQPTSEEADRTPLCIPIGLDCEDDAHTMPCVRSDSLYELAEQWRTLKVPADRVASADLVCDQDEMDGPRPAKRARRSSSAEDAWVKCQLESAMLTHVAFIKETDSSVDDHSRALNADRAWMSKVLYLLKAGEIDPAYLLKSSATMPQDVHGRSTLIEIEEAHARLFNQQMVAHMLDRVKDCFRLINRVGYCGPKHMILALPIDYIDELQRQLRSSHHGFYQDVCLVPSPQQFIADGHGYFTHAFENLMQTMQSAVGAWQPSEDVLSTLSQFDESLQGFQQIHQQHPMIFKKLRQQYSLLDVLTSQDLALDDPSPSPVGRQGLVFSFPSPGIAPNMPSRRTSMDNTSGARRALHFFRPEDPGSSVPGSPCGVSPLRRELDGVRFFSKSLSPTPQHVRLHPSLPAAPAKDAMHAACNPHPTAIPRFSGVEA